MTAGRQLQTSTIAWTIYNWLAVHARGPCTPEEIADGIAAWVTESRISLTTSQLGTALRELERRGYLRAMPGDSFDLADPERRVLVGRDRRDVTGWRGWMVGQGIVAPRQLLDAVLR
jgi:hypothetical protein